MKKIISVFVIAVIFTACKSDKSGSDKNSVEFVQDTSTLYNNNITTDKSHDKKMTGATAGSALATAPVKTYNKPASTNNSVNNNVAANNSAASTASANTTNKKKGWSHRARGAAVGAGTGAITGAIVNKNNRGMGALIGGIVGAASGYIIGNEVDKKKEKENK